MFATDWETSSAWNSMEMWPAQAAARRRLLTRQVPGMYDVFSTTHSLNYVRRASRSTPSFPPLLRARTAVPALVEASGPIATTTIRMAIRRAVSIIEA